MQDVLNSCFTLINRCGDAYWDFASLMFIQVIVLVVVLFALDLVLRHKVRAVVRYWIWLLVLAKLVLPTDLRTPASVAYWLPASETARSERPSETAERDLRAPPMDQTGAIDLATQPIASGVVDSMPRAATEAVERNQPRGDSLPAVASPGTLVPRAQLNWRGMVFIGWGTAVALLLAMLRWRAGKVRALVAAASAAPGGFETLLRECLPEVAMEPGRVRLLVTDRLGSPAICGFFRPTILLPSLGLTSLDCEQIRLIFLHELVHWKRGDLQVNYLQTVLQILYFYHPAIWLAGLMVRRLREQAVDETVLVMARGDADRYATTLLDLATLSLPPAESMLRLIGVVESRAALAGRIRRIVARPLPKTSKVGLTGLAAILLLGLLLVPMARSERPASKGHSAAASDAGKPADRAAATETTAGDEKNADEARCALSGRIVDDTGAPVTDATIEMSFNRGGTELTASTDEAGRYAFEKVAQAGEYRIRITSKRWVGVHNRDAKTVDLVEGTPAVRDFTLPRACRLKLEVVNEDGKPVSGVQIYSNLPSQEDYVFSEAVVTDKQGRAMLGGLKPAAVEKRLVATMSDQYALNHLDLVLDDSEVVTQQRIVLKKGRSVKGQALCSDGKPAAGWRISAMPTWWRLGVSPLGQVMKPDGSFELLHVGDDRYDLTISVPTGESGWTPKTVLANTPLLPGADPLTVTIDHPSPAAMTKITGHIEYKGGKLERGFHIMAFSTTGNHHGDAFVKPGQTEFELGPVPPGTYTIDFQSQEIEAENLRNVVVPTKPLEVKITVRGTLNLRGTVVDAKTDNPIPRFSAQVTKQGTLRGPNFAQKPEWHEFAGKEGAFAVDLVGPGIYSLNVTADGFTPAGIDAINTDTGPTKDLRITLATGQSLSGTVVDLGGQPVDGARVIPFLPGGLSPSSEDEAGKNKRTVVTAKGAFTIEHFAFGKESLQISHPDFAVTLVPSVAAPPANGSEPLTITLDRGAKVRGRVYDNEGKPVANTPLFFNRRRFREQSQNDPTGELATVVTDGEGFYEAGHLPEDDCYVSRADLWTTFGVVRQMIRTQNGKTETLDFGGTAQTTGQLIVNGRPAANTKLLISGKSPHYGPIRSCVQTDGKGAFVFRGIPAGQRTLFYCPTSDEREAVAAKTFNALAAGMDLGTVELTMVRVAVLKPDSVNDSQIWLEPYDAKWQFGSGLGILRPLRKPDEPLAFEHVTPGKYELVCNRPKQFSVRQAVEVTTAPEQTVALKLPTGTASLSGKCDKSICGTNGFPRNLFVWSKDQRLLDQIVPEEDGSYRLENIPAGEYFIRRYPTRDADVILKVSLGDGENKELDITPENTSPESARPTGFRYVCVYTADGIALPDCEVSFPQVEHSPELRSSLGGKLLFMGKNAARHEMAVAYPGFKPVHQTLELRPLDMGPTGEDGFLRIFLQPE